MLSERSKQVRRDTIKLMYEHGGSHYGGSLSCIEILIALYDHVLTDKDVFLLSKGHACWPLYVLLREKGLNPKIEHHPHRDPGNGLHMTSGSLGHGIPFGMGVALAKKLKGEVGRVYVLCGEGDLQEGSCWESMLILEKLGYQPNIKIVLDYNNIQGSDWTNNVLPNHLFQYDACVDGHDVDDLVGDISYANYKLIYASTSKGHGVSFMENDPCWHSRQLTEKEYIQAMEELA